MTFPANAPSPWVTLTSSYRCNLIPAGDSPVFTLSAANEAATYDVQNMATGEVVASGMLSTTDTMIVCPSSLPFGGYRLHLYSTTSASAGVTNFHVLCPAPHLPANAAPGTPGVPYDLHYTGPDNISRAVMDVSAYRWYYDPRDEAANGGFTKEMLAADVANELEWWASVQDPARPRQVLCQLPNAPYDHVRMDASVTGDQNGPQVYAKDLTIDPSTTWISSDGSGNLIVSTGASATTLTQVESWPISAPVTDGEQRFLNIDASNYIRAFTEYQGYQGMVANQAPRCLAETLGTNLHSLITAMVVAAYPAGLTRFEGQNEPPPDNGFGIMGQPWGGGGDTHGAGAQETVHVQTLLREAILAGAPNAVLVGPCNVSPCFPGNNNGTTIPTYPAPGLDAILAWSEANGLTPYAEISQHGYNAQNGDTWMCDEAWGLFNAILSGRSLSADKRRMTEMGDFAAVYGVLHMRRQLSWTIRRFLTQEAIAGIRNEDDDYYYPTSHGFWNFPSFWLAGDKTCSLLVSGTRALSVVRYGKTFAAQLNLGNASTFARAYHFTEEASSGAGDMLTLFTVGSASATATVNVSAAGTIQDVFGNTTTLAEGTSTVPISDLPTYLLVPAGTTITVTDINKLISATLVTGGTDTASTTSTQPIAYVQEGYRNPYLWGNGIAAGAPGSPWFDTTGTIPCTFTRTFAEAETINGLWFLGLPPWQNCSAPTAFTVEAEVNGVWVEQYSYENDTAVSVGFVDGTSGFGCTRETVWNEEWVFDCPFPAVVSATALRITATALSYGGEPDLAATQAGGQGGTPAFIVNTITPYLTAQSPPPPGFHIVTKSLPTATVGKAYSTTLEVAGNTTTYVWAATHATLPRGLTLSAAGVLSGTLKSGDAAKTYQIAVKVTEQTHPKKILTAILPLVVVA